MSVVKIAAVLVIAAGIVGLAYGRLSFTREVPRASVGPISLTSRDTETIAIPIWMAVGAIVVGGLMLNTTKRGMRT